MILPTTGNQPIFVLVIFNLLRRVSFQTVLVWHIHDVAFHAHTIALEPHEIRNSWQQQRNIFCFSCTQLLLEIGLKGLLNL